MTTPIAPAAPAAPKQFSQLSGPESLPEAGFELGNRPHVGPDVTVEDSLNRRVVHASFTSQRSDALLSDDFAEIQRKATRNLPDQVGGFKGRPTGAKAPRSRPRNASHEPRVEHESPPHGIGTAELRIRQDIGYSNSHAVADAIVGYTPRVPKQHWLVIGPFVRAAVTDFNPSTTIQAKAIMSVLREFVLWAWRQGLELNRDALFTQGLALAFLAGFGEHQDRTRQTLLTQVLNWWAEDGERADLRVGTGPQPTAPYVQKELAQFFGWANGQTTPSRRRKAMAILCLGAGAGMTLHEMNIARVGDVVRDGDDVTILIRTNGRVVTLVNVWADQLAVTVAGRSANDLLIEGNRSGTASASALASFLKSSRSLVARPVFARLRATWIVQQLQSGTPVDVLVVAAGFSDIRSLERYFIFIKRDARAAAAALRDAPFLQGRAR